MSEMLHQVEQKPIMKGWAEFAREDRKTVSSYLFENGDDLGPDEDFRIPASDYISREMHDLEVKHLWTTTWQWACRANDLPNVGDYLEYEIVGRSIIVVRANNGRIKAFRNACRHRATALVAGCGHASSFYCPFHGWAYGLDGKLEHVPGGWDFPHVDRKGLWPVRLEEFNGGVYVNLDDEAPSLAEQLGPTLMRHLSVYPDTNMWKAWHFGLVVEANWKVMAEAFFEAYHVPALHAQIAMAAGDVQNKVDVFGLHHRLLALALVPPASFATPPTEQVVLDTFMGVSGGYGQGAGSGDSAHILPPGKTAREFVADFLRSQSGANGIDLSEVSDSEVLDSISYLVFPNFVNYIGPAGHLNYRFRPNGNDHESMIYEIMSLRPVPPGAPLPPDSPLHMLPRGVLLQDHDVSRDAMTEAFAEVIDQDVVNSARVQKGLQVAHEVVAGKSLEPDIVAFHRNLKKWIEDRAVS